MITKHFSQLCHHDLGVVIRCVAVGRAKKNPYIIAGCIDCSLYIFDKNCHLVQKITFGNWVRCCAMGDIDGDGDAEIVAGSGDKTVKILKLIGDKFQEIRSLDFPHIVNACAIADITGDGIPKILVGTWGAIVYALDPPQYKILWQKEFRGWINFICPGDVTGSGRTDLLIGTRDGAFYVVEGTDAHVIWDYAFPKEINAATLADVDNSGVPSILVGGNSEVLTIFNSQGNIQREISLQNRILSIAVGDIDGDHANEIVLGCSDNTLRVLENRTRALEGISLKWRGKFDNTIRGIQIFDLLGNGINNIIFGGYNKVLQSIQDFHWGKKPKIEIYPVPLAIASTGASTGASEFQFFVLEKINRIEDLLANSQQELMDIRALNPQPGVSAKSEEEVPERITFPIDLLTNIEAEEKPSQIPRTPSFLIPRITPEITKPITPSGISPAELPVTQVAPPIPETEVSPAPFAQYCNQVVEHLKQVGVISSKAKLVEVIKSLGIPEESVENILIKLLDDRRLTYSRTTPRGYGLVEGVPIAPVQVKKTAKRAKKPAKQAKKVVKPAVTPVILPVSPDSASNYQAGNVNAEIERAYAAVKTKGLIPTKPELSKVLEQTGIAPNLIEAIINNLKESGRLTYSRSAPRGYSAI